MLAAILGAMAFAPHLAKRLRAGTGHHEQRAIEDLARGFMRSVERQLRIPGPDDWIEPVAAVIGRSAAEVAQVFPRFTNDTTTRRRLILDPRLGPGLIPYEQSELGIVSGAAELLGPYARAVLVSSSQRGLALPWASGAISAAEFDALWNWNPAATGSSPPPGWPAAWQGNGDRLHIARINLSDAFTRVSLNNLQYSLNGVGSAWFWDLQDRWFLRGTLLSLQNSLGELVRSHVVLNPVDLSLSPPDAVWYLAGSLTGLAMDGIPESVLSLVRPAAPLLPNHDPLRNLDPGLTLMRGGSGLQETDARKVQRWVTVESGPYLNSRVSLFVYCAVKNFDTQRGGALVATLFDSNPTASNRDVLATAQVTRSDWDVADSGTWIVERFDFGVVRRPVTLGRRLGVMLHVPAESPQDMWVAYGAVGWLSRIEAVTVGRR